MSFSSAVVVLGRRIVMATLVSLRSLRYCWCRIRLLGTWCHHVKNVARLALQLLQIHKLYTWETIMVFGIIHRTVAINIGSIPRIVALERGIAPAPSMRQLQAWPNLARSFCSGRVIATFGNRCLA